MAEDSILFAIDADRLFREEKFEETAKLCLSGIESFPDYPLAYAILTKSYCKLGKFTEAQDTMANAISNFPGNKILIKTNEELNECLEKEQSKKHIKAEEPIDDFPQPKKDAESEIKLKIFSNISKMKFKRENPVFSASDLDLIPGISPLALFDKRTNREIYLDLAEFPPFPKIRKKEKNIFGKNVSIGEDEISRLAKALESSAKIEKSKNEFPNPKRNTQTVVSEMMGNIYEKQQAWDSALQVWEQLAKKRPEKKEYFESKALEVQKKLKSEN